MKIDRAGWIVAAALLGCIAGLGFQAKTDKTGSVDLARVFNDSEYLKTQVQTLKDLDASRRAVIEFVSTYRFMKPEDQTRFHDLSIKANPTAADKADTEKLKQAALALDQKFRDLSTKANLTDIEKAQLEEYNRNAQGNDALRQKWSDDFTSEVRTVQDKLRTDTLARAKTAVQQVAKEQGYTIVFTQDVAPYSANDLTDAALKAMNSKK